ncbi:MAG TPA: hypothetical protein VGE52_03845, partial [Pirellulales bacterium]
MSVAASHPHHDAHSPERTARRPSAAMRVAGSAAGLNTLFQLLHRIDVEGLAGKLVVRRGAKFVAGAWRTRAGQVCAAATVQGRTLLAEQLVAECSMPPAQALQTAEAALSSSGGLSRGGLAAAAGLDAAAGRRVALAFTARECLQTALFCGADSPEIVRLGEADATESWAFDGLE